MMSLDDRLRDLFESSGPDVAELRGDLRQVRARVRQRTLRRRAAFGAVAAAIVAGGAFLLLDGDIGDDVRTDVPPADESTTTITAPDPTTTEDPASGPGTTVTSTSSSTSTSTSSSTTTTTAPPGPSIRDVDLREATYANSCPGWDDDRPATLSGGVADLPAGDGVTHQVHLDAVGYGDADGDGDEDAVVMLGCSFLGTSTGNSGVLRAYQATADGSIEQIGSSHLFEHPRAPAGTPTAAGLSITVHLDVFAPTDGMCCPSSAVNETWRFDGTDFVLTGSTPAQPSGGG
jgi:hypothetical protein